MTMPLAAVGLESLSALEEFQDLIPDVQPRCGPDEKIGEFAIVRRNDLLSLDAVSVEGPFGQEYGRSLVSFRETLSTGHPISHGRRHPDGVLETACSLKSSTNS